jgi:hypothetical protein
MASIDTEVVSSLDQKVTLSASSAQSTAFTPSTSIRITSDVDCWLAFGLNPTATTSSCYLPAKSPEVFAVPTGWKVAGIAAGAGNLYISVVSDT